MYSGDTKDTKINKLHKAHLAESRSLKSFLNLAQPKEDGLGNDNASKEVLEEINNEVNWNKESVNGAVGTAEQTLDNSDLETFDPSSSEQSQEGVNAANGLNTDSCSEQNSEARIGSKGERSAKMSQGSQAAVAAKELETLKKSLEKMKEGSIERMLLEMRIDMKKDSVAIMEKMDNVVETTNKLVIDVRELKESNRDFESRLKNVQDGAEEQSAALEAMDRSVKKLEEQVRILHGVVQKQDQRLMISRMEKENDAVKSMSNNLVISGLDEVAEETEAKTAELVTDFFSQTMKISSKIPLNSAQRIGKSTPRTILVKLQDGSNKGEIFKHAKNLKEVKNNSDGAIFVNNQLPQSVQEIKMQYRKWIRHNHGLTDTNKRNMEMKKGELYVDNQPYDPPVKPPECIRAYLSN